MLLRSYLKRSAASAYCCRFASNLTRLRSSALTAARISVRLRQALGRFMAKFPLFFVYPLAMIFALFNACVGAQSYPAKSIRVIVPWPAGGTTDILARIVGQQLNTNLGQPVVIDNRGGASGNIGSEAAVKAPADG